VTVRKSGSVDRGEISQFISQIEDRYPKALKALANYFQADSLRRSICFTGPAGVGKSTLIARLLPLAAKSMRVAWLACDPSSPVSGGSLLGDRIRSSGQDLSQSIFIRSMSTRGMSAFSQSIRDVEVYLEHFFDRIWVETAGSGQTQSEVARISALTVLVLQPETGDEVQWMKSGVREWCDLFVIHKSDLPGGDLMKQSLIEMGANPEAVVQVSSKTGEGLSELNARLEKSLSAVKWKDRAAVLHGSLAEALYMERESMKLRKQFSKKRAKLLKQPY
jgi:LAO/AO transport system kinase